MEVWCEQRVVPLADSRFDFGFQIVAGTARCLVWIGPSFVWIGQRIRSWAIQIRLLSRIPLSRSLVRCFSNHHPRSWMLLILIRLVDWNRKMTRSPIERTGFAEIGFATVGCSVRCSFVVDCLSFSSHQTSTDFRMTCSFHRQQVDHRQGLVLCLASFRRDHFPPVHLRDCLFARPLLHRIEFRHWATRPGRSRMTERRSRH